MGHNLVNSPFIREERVEMRRIGQKIVVWLAKRKRESIFCICSPMIESLFNKCNSVSIFP